MTLSWAGPPRAWSPDADPFERVLVICAHPDDVDFGAAGTVAAFVEHGIDVRYCIVTDGEAGGTDRAQPRAEMATIRRHEQEMAAEAVGVHSVTFLGHPDGRLVATLELRRDLTREIRRFAPDLVVAPSPERNWTVIYASHPDHLAAGEAALCAVYPDSRNAFAHPELLEEGFEPHTVRALWLMASPTANVAVDITDVFLAKVSALACHKSQGGSNPDLTKLLADWGRDSAASAGLPEGRLAEQFWEIRTA